MTKIKICGITSFKDAYAAVRLGVDALGFVFYPESPRSVTPEKVKMLRWLIPPQAHCIGVFVNETAEQVLRIAMECNLDGVQFHGDEPPEYCWQFSNFYTIKAFSPRSKEELRGIEKYAVQSILIDAFYPDYRGGTGKRAHWGLAQEAKQFGPLTLAGGLHEENVQEAIRTVRPYAVDASSCLEAAPGAKDHEKMRRFVENVRKADLQSIRQTVLQQYFGKRGK